MTTTRTRQRRIPESPRCAADLIVVEQRQPVAEAMEVPSWMNSRTCSRACLLTVEDFPNAARA
jgi:hypothetical protein